MFETKAVEKITTQFHVQYIFFKSRSLWYNVEKYGTARQATYDNIMLRGNDALCMPGN
jgi:hypothetical protein